MAAAGDVKGTSCSPDGGPLPLAGEAGRGQPQALHLRHPSLTLPRKREREQLCSPIGRDNIARLIRKNMRKI